MRTASANALLSGVVDYAGLFPPAALDMRVAVHEYRAAAAGPDAWMLGRFVIPASRLEELAALLRETPGSDWRVSAIVRADQPADAAAIDAFNGEALRLGMRVDCIECKPATLDGIDALARTFADDFEIYVEIAPGPSADAWFARVAARGLRAKVRTGGVTPDAFLEPPELASLLAGAVRSRVPLKATAGLHHAVRGAYRLTYAPDSASAPMYGYLNVLLATAALEAGASAAEAEALLQAADPASLVFGADAVRWNGAAFPLSALHVLRRRGLVSFGSCSFREPASEFAALSAR